MAKRPGANRMGQRVQFSDIDLRKINKLYTCGLAVSTSNRVVDETVAAPPSLPLPSIPSGLLVATGAGGVNSANNSNRWNGYQRPQVMSTRQTYPQQQLAVHQRSLPMAVTNMLGGRSGWMAAPQTAWLRG